MAKDYPKLASEIVNAVGGEKNIIRLTHCMTRLRFGLKDESIPDDNVVANIPGVIQVVRQSGEYQVVIGNDVAKVYDEIHLSSQPTNTSEVKNENTNSVQEKGSVLNRIFGFIAGCMSPLMPAMLGGGMIKVIMTLLTTFGIISSTDSTAIILSAAGDVFFYFLPIFLAFTASNRLGNNPYIAMIIGGLLLHPDLIGLLAKGDTSYFGLPVTAVSYSSSVLPILLMVPIIYYLEKLADKISPQVLKSFMKPMIVIFLAIPIALIVVGPLGSILGNYLSAAINFLYNHVGWLAIMILSAIMPFVIMTGMHWALLPIATIGLAELGYDAVLIVTMFSYNLAIGGATLAVALKNKNQTIKSEALASGISAILAGVSEPALYGFAMKYRTVLYAAMFGAGVSGFYAGITHLVAYSMGVSPSALSLLQMIGDNGSTNIINGIVALLIAVIVSFAASYVMYKTEDNV